MSNLSRMTPLAAARWYAERGFIPLPCQREAKKPSVKNWQARNQWYWNHEMLCRNITEQGNLGLLCGPYASGEYGLVAIDIDRWPTNLGQQPKERVAFIDIVMRIAEAEKAPVQITPRGGQHVLFRYRSADIALKSGTNVVGPNTKIDLRAEGGFIVCCPSRTADGQYRWQREPVGGIDIIPLLPRAEVAPFFKWETNRPVDEPSRANNFLLHDSCTDLPRIRAALDARAARGEADDHDAWLDVVMSLAGAACRRELPRDIALQLAYGFSSRSMKFDDKAKDRIGHMFQNSRGEKGLASLFYDLRAPVSQVCWRTGDRDRDHAIQSAVEALLARDRNRAATPGSAADVEDIITACPSFKRMVLLEGVVLSLHEDGIWKASDHGEPPGLREEARLIARAMAHPSGDHNEPATMGEVAAVKASQSITAKRLAIIDGSLWNQRVEAAVGRQPLPAIKGQKPGIIGFQCGTVIDVTGLGPAKRPWRPDDYLLGVVPGRASVAAEALQKLAQSPDWLEAGVATEFVGNLLRLFDRDRDSVRYFVAGVGSAFLGQPADQKAYVIGDAAGVGKSALLKQLAAVCGGLAVEIAAPNVLGQQPSDHLVLAQKLNGKRLLLLPEVRNDDRIAVSRFNQLVAGEIVTAGRRLYKSTTVDVCFQGRVLLATNSPPRAVGEGSESFYRRILKFEVTDAARLDDSVRRNGYGDVLDETSASEIAALLIHGGLQFSTMGQIPARVHQANAADRRKTNIVEAFLADGEWIKKDPAAPPVPTKDVFTCFCQWLRDVEGADHLDVHGTHRKWDQARFTNAVPQDYRTDQRVVQQGQKLRCFKNLRLVCACPSSALRI